jgi:TonB family protein
MTLKNIFDFIKNFVDSIIGLLHVFFDWLINVDLTFFIVASLTIYIIYKVSKKIEAFTDSFLKSLYPNKDLTSVGEAIFIVLFISLLILMFDFVYPNPNLMTGETKASYNELTTKFNQTKDEYVKLVSSLISNNKEYPTKSQKEGHEGKTIVDIQIDPSGKILSEKIQTSSGYEELDNEAIEMIKKSNPLPAPPIEISKKQIIISVPISFKLQ